MVRRLLLLFILVAATGLRLHDITRHSLWMDELFTMQLSAGHGLEHHDLAGSGLIENVPDLLGLNEANPIGSVATSLARDDNHPPLYFYLVRWWRGLFGSSDFALRSLSVVFSVLAVALLYDVATKLHGRTSTALWAAAIMAVSGTQIQFAHEGRSYALLTALSLGALAALVRIERLGASRPRLVALSTCVCAMMLTHYYAIAPAVAIGLYVLIRLSGRTRRDTIVALAIAAMTFTLLWGWGTWQQRFNIGKNNWWVIDTYPGNYAARTALRFTLLPYRFLTEPLLRSEPVAAVGAVLYVLPLLMLRRRGDLLLWVLWLWSTAMMVLVLDLSKHARQLDFQRYTIIAAPAVYALIPAIVPAAWAWARHALSAVAVMVCLFALPQTYAQTLTPKPDWRIPTALIDRIADPDDITIIYGDSSIEPGYTGCYYLALRHYAAKLPGTVVFISTPPDAALLAKLHQAHAVWLVVPGEVDLPPDAFPGLVETDRCFVFGLPRLQRLIPR